jgi:hypothetical protein
MKPDMFMQLAGNVGAMAFILWLVWRTQNYTIPRLVKDFKEGIEKSRQEFKESLDKQRNDFKEVTANARTDFLDQMKEQRIAAKEERDKDREQTAKIIQALQKQKGD